MNKKKWFFLSILSFCFIYLLCFQIIAIWPFTIDDMFISLRYAKNWADGHGLLWNIGDEPVEGYSNFSFVALAALALHSGFAPLILLKSLGFSGLILSTCALYLLSRLWFTKLLALIPCIWLLLYRGEIVWSISGLETTCYQALIYCALFFLLRGMGYDFYPQKRKAANTAYFILAGFFLALAGLTRPETPVLMLVFMGLALLDSPKGSKKDYFRGLFLGCLSCLLLFLPYFLWRWNYYGRLFPNPVYCKSFGFFAVLDKRYLYLAMPFFILALPAIFKAKDKRHYFFWLPSLVYLGLLIDADPVSAFENRLFLPAFGLLLPLAFLGLSQLALYFWQRSDEVYLFSLVLSAGIIAFFFIPMLSLGGYRYFTLNPQGGIKLREEILAWLDEHIKPDSRVVLADSGQIPYKSALRYIDSYCLNNKAMTSPPNKQMYEKLCKEIFISKPEVLILTGLQYEASTTYSPADICLHEKLKNSKDYQFRITYTKDCKQYSYRYEIYTLLN